MQLKWKLMFDQSNKYEIKRIFDETSLNFFSLSNLRITRGFKWSLITDGIGDSQSYLLISFQASE